MLSLLLTALMVSQGSHYYPAENPDNSVCCVCSSLGCPVRCVCHQISICAVWWRCSHWLTFFCGTNSSSCRYQVYLGMVVPFVALVIHVRWVYLPFFLSLISCSFRLLHLQLPALHKRLVGPVGNIWAADHILHPVREPKLLNDVHTPFPFL